MSKMLKDFYVGSRDGNEHRRRYLAVEDFIVRIMEALVQAGLSESQSIPKQVAKQTTAKSGPAGFLDDDDEEDEDDKDEEIKLSNDLLRFQQLPSAKAPPDVLNYWRYMQHTFPALATVARTVYAMPAASVEPERLFSCAGYITASSRGSLAAPSLQAQASARFHLIQRRKATQKVLT